MLDRYGILDGWIAGSIETYWGIEGRITFPDLARGRVRLGHRDTAAQEQRVDGCGAEVVRAVAPLVPGPDADMSVDRVQLVAASERYYAGERSRRLPSRPPRLAYWEPGSGNVQRHNDYVHYESDALAKVLLKPVIGAVAARLAQRLRTGCATDCLAIDLDPRGLLVERRTLGRYLARQLVLGRPAIATVPPRRLDLAALVASPAGTWSYLEVTQPPPQVRRLEVRERARSSQEIETAAVVVAVGRGVRAAADLHLAEDLAATLGGALAATRPLTTRSSLVCGPPASTAGPRAHRARRCGRTSRSTLRRPMRSAPAPGRESAAAPPTRRCASSKRASSPRRAGASRRPKQCRCSPTSRTRRG